MAALSSVVRHLSKSPLTDELIDRLQREKYLTLNGAARVPKGLVTSAIVQKLDKPLLLICATLEEAARWASQLEIMGWDRVLFYPTSESSPYEPFSQESEMVWGQMQVLSTLVNPGKKTAIVATERSLQPHLPPPEIFNQYCLNLTPGSEVMDLTTIGEKLARLGYEKTPLVEMEGQWSRRGDIIDIFPVSAELPVRLEWFGDELERLREFDPANQRSLDTVDGLTLTPTGFDSLIRGALPELELETEGVHRFLGQAFDQVCSLVDYLPKNTFIAMDEVEQCFAHSSLWRNHAQEQWEGLTEELPRLHRTFEDCLKDLERYYQIYLSELATDFKSDLISGGGSPINLQSRPVPVGPHQFGKVAEMLRGKREIYQGMTLEKYSSWLISAQPSRSVSLLQEHDCGAQFVPNPEDYQAIDRLQTMKEAVALKYSGLAELEGFILPTYRVVLISDREFFGQHALATPTYIRKRRRATSKQVDLNKLSPGDYVVHKSHGIGQFIGLETLQSREYIGIKYADGLLRVPADSLDTVSRYHHAPDEKPPTLNKMTGKSWTTTRNKIRKSIKKLAVDLVKLYAKRAKHTGYAYPPDNPWQQELEDSFPYQPTPDQLKATQDVKLDLESDRPMDRLVCGDVGFGKTEVAIRSIFKVITSGNKQVAFLAPTTILAQQHYHTLKERYAPYPINIGLLNRFRSATERKEIIARLATGELDLVVGTHQILSKEVKFKDLGLLVIDEEQRFGVNQKEKIKAYKAQVDVLTLTATPIPRTLYMSLSGIREMSLITTPPPSRRPIATHLSPYDPEVIRTAIRNELDRGGQIFYVVPRVDGIEEIAAQLREMIPSLRVAIAHGQMDESQLEATMLAFDNGEADLLVCTTIVESGLDIPRVNTILIEDSHKFGLSQLYQLRGRVGRSGIQAHAWLLFPNRRTLPPKAVKRLKALKEFSQLGSGYQLATRDMEIRGVGNLLGAEQSGQVMTIGYELYMEMLKEAMQEVQGQEIPTVDETKIELKVTAFIPESYISDPEQKLAAYRQITMASSKRELVQIAADWSDLYGPLPSPAEQLLQVVELKQIAKPLGFSKIKTDGKQHVILETPMAEPAFKLLLNGLPKNLHSRFVYGPKKVTVRGLGVIKPAKQLESLIEWLGTMRDALPETEIV